MAVANFSLPPGSTIGILGGGQLGRMLAMAAAELGYRTHVYCPEADAPASEVAKFTTVAAYEDKAVLSRFAKSVDVVTYEFENIPQAPVAWLAEQIVVRPDPQVLAVCQHRVLEKEAINKFGVGTAAFRAVRSAEELEQAAKALGLPAVLKTAMMGYDGKGQWIIRHPRECGDLGPWNVQPEIPAQGGDDMILESFVPFRMEISVIVARDARGNMACYDAVQNIHKHHILSETLAPAPIAPELAAKAQDMARKIAEGLGLVGLLAVEMFITPPPTPPASGGGEDDGDILVNELAPRPHNSGHWTLDACVTSQFEQTIRAICGLPLGSTQRLCDARMVNLIGDEVKEWQKYLAMPNAKLHLYGKKEARAGRKMGHVTLLNLK